MYRLNIPYKQFYDSLDEIWLYRINQNAPSTCSKPGGNSGNTAYGVDVIMANISGPSLLYSQIVLEALLEENIAIPGYFSYILFYRYLFCVLSSSLFVIAVCGSI